ncbi:MAG: tyrosinase family protein [Gammaproteobacteria bacterium]|nr:tyrosinase family protein [Gammaproteobacteria bacterium]MDH5800128.1 tyrosinase family protein [Gammaproteobacteria bacterium]
MRIRKNAALLSDAEWKRYLNAVVALKHTFPAGSGVSIYDQFVAMHWCVWGLGLGGTGPAAGVDGAHNGPAFLPWHREYLRRYEEALAAVDPQVSLPYWNWGFGTDEETNDLFVDDHMGPRGGIISSGYFASSPTPQNPLGWSIHPDLQAFSATLRRTGTAGPGSLPTADAIIETMEMNTYSSFRPALEGGSGLTATHNSMHNGVHGWVGGDMGRMTSPNDPIFFMHHAQIDRIWAMWQQRHPGVAHYNDADIFVGQGHGPNDNMWPWDAAASTPTSATVATALTMVPTEAMVDVVTPTDVLNTRDLGYLYDGEETQFEFNTTATSVTHQWSTINLNVDYGNAPCALADMQTFAGNNTASVRIQNATADHLQVSVQEEKSRDREVTHVAEAIGYLMGNPGLIYNASGRVIGEIAKLRMGQPGRKQWERVTLRNSYQSPVVIAKISSFNGDQPAQIRLQSTDHDFFELQIEEWAYLDGIHNFEDISFLVLESGSHRMRNGTLLEAGTTSTNHNWKTVNFNSMFTTAPTVLSQCMTRNGTDPVVTRQRNINPGSCDLRLQEEEAKLSGRHVNETVAYIALAQP